MSFFVMNMGISFTFHKQFVCENDIDFSQLQNALVMDTCASKNLGQ